MYQYRATVVRWVDGDTVELTVDLGFRVNMTETFRLYDPNGYIDTPERGEPNYNEAKSFSESMYPPGRQFVVNTYKKDKYGRWLVHIPDLNLGLEQHGLLKPTKG